MDKRKTGGFWSLFCEEQRVKDRWTDIAVGC